MTEPVPSPVFSRPYRIRFSDCDPAGIVFYPQYFVMMNDLTEQWVDSGLPEGYAGMIKHHRCGLPTVRLEADFRAISQMGDDVVLSITPLALAQRSYTSVLACTSAAGELRMQMQQTVVTTDLDTHKARAVPDFLRALFPTGLPQKAG